MSTDKDEATRLADHLQQFILATNPSPDGNWRKIEALLRRWPDGEPVAEVEADGVLRFKKTGWKWKVGDKLYTAPPAERITALEGEAPALPKADVSVPFYKETVTLAQGDYYRADKVLPLLKNWAVLYAAAKAGHEQAFAQSQEKSERIAALEAEVEALRVDAALWRHVLRKGLVTVHSETLHPPNPHTRVSWAQGHAKSCDISNDAARSKTT